MTKKKIIPYILLCLISLLLVGIMTPSNALFGSTTDWFSQHISICDSFRIQYYETGNLFPDYINLGAGQNIFAFAYYGLYRPDVLISYFLPMIEMKDIIITSMILHLIASVCLMYYFLKSKVSHQISFFAALLLLTSSIFFHSHRQIMFVNYMPYLILSLISIDILHEKKMITPYILSVFFMILYSYFFSVSGIIVSFIYYVFTVKKFKSKETIKFISGILISIILASFLLIPTAYVMFEHKRNTLLFDYKSLLKPNINFNGLLYDEYGCGFTSIVLVLLILGLNNKKTRNLSLLLLSFFVFPIFAYLGNGTLYVRNKVFITCIPLILYLCANVLKDVKYTKRIHLIVMILFCFIITIQPMDVLLTLLIIFLYYHYKKEILLYLISFMLITNVFLQNKQEEYVSNSSYMNAYDSEKLETLKTIKNERIQDFTSPLAISNQLHYPGISKISMYTSITNTEYNHFYYDILKNPIRIRNRVAILDSPNIFTQMFMNIKYVYTEDKQPLGYHNTEYKNLYKNEHVLPYAFGTTHLMNESEFDKLKCPYHLDILLKNAVVNDHTKNFQDTDILKKTDILPERISIDHQKDMIVPIDLKDNEILIIKMNLNHIKDKRKEISVSINNIVNKYSGTDAAYPNHHTEFTYIVTSTNELNFKFSKGMYDLSNIETYVLDYKQLINDIDIQYLKLSNTNKNEILNGRIEMKEDGYFITSYPIQKGYEVQVDGKYTEIETVNKAFVGFPLSKGVHDISIKFYSPGKVLGQIVSIFGWIIFIYMRNKERKKL